MPINLPKGAGWVLLAIGLLIILYSIYSSYNIFTAKVPAPMIFSTAASQTAGSAKEGAGKIDQSKMSKEQLAQQQIQESMQKTIMEGLQSILPADTIPKILNLMTWSMFAAILFWGGSTVAGLGIKLLKA